jgi:hypothetical protein
VLPEAWPLLIGETADDCSANATHDRANRSSNNGTAYGTRGRASRRSSGLSGIIPSVSLKTGLGIQLGATRFSSDLQQRLPCLDCAFSRRV